MICRSRLVVPRAAAVWGLLFASGCGVAPIDFTEVRRLEEAVTSGEWDRFVRIVRSLPRERLPTLPAAFAGLPEWAPDRTLPVRELVHETERQLNADWEANRWGAILARDRAVMRALRRERWTPEQLAAIIQTLGVAHAANQLRANQSVERLLDQSQVPLQQLQSDERTFSSLNRDEQYLVLQNAAWVVRRDRARRLQRPPAQNRNLTERHATWLARVLPPEFCENQLDSIRDRLADEGLPFEELPSSGTDRELTWDPATILKGEPAVETSKK